MAEISKIKIGYTEEAARLILLDTYADNYRFEPKEIYEAMQEGCKRINSLRPESRYVAGLLTDLAFPPIPSTLPQSEIDTFREKSFNMESRWQEALTHYIVFKMYLKDDPDTSNQGLAKQYYDLFITEVNS